MSSYTLICSLIMSAVAADVCIYDDMPRRDVMSCKMNDVLSACHRSGWLMGVGCSRIQELQLSWSPPPPGRPVQFVPMSARPGMLFKPLVLTWLLPPSGAGTPDSSMPDWG